MTTYALQQHSSSSIPQPVSGIDCNYAYSKTESWNDFPNVSIPIEPQYNSASFGIRPMRNIDYPEQVLLKLSRIGEKTPDLPFPGDDAL